MRSERGNRYMRGASRPGDEFDKLVFKISQVYLLIKDVAYF